MTGPWNSAASAYVAKASIRGLPFEDRVRVAFDARRRRTADLERVELHPRHMRGMEQLTQAGSEVALDMAERAVLRVVFSAAAFREFEVHARFGTPPQAPITFLGGDPDAPPEDRPTTVWPRRRFPQAHPRIEMVGTDDVVILDFDAVA